MTTDDISNGTEFVTSDSETPVRIKVVGVGGGGNNAINHMYRQGINGVSFVNINTDRQALKASPVPTKLQIGPGLGAGNKPEVALELAEQAAGEINALFDDDAEMVFITAGMGGGTGTGAAPVVARVAKERGLLTIGIVTIPFNFEGQKKILKAIAGADEMSKYVDALMVIDNERLTEIYRDLDLLNAFAKADDTLLMAAQSISDLITCEAHMNLDIEDVKTTLRDSGTAIISYGFGEGEHRVTKAIEDALNSPLLRNNDIKSSTRLLFNFYISRKATHPFKMDEVNEMTEFVTGLHSDVDVIWGIGFDDTLDDKVKITVLAAGFGQSALDIDARKQHAASKAAERKASESVKSGDIVFSEPAPQRQPLAAQSSGENRLGQMYGSKIDEIKRIKNAARYAVLTPEQLDDDAVLEVVESTTYNRDRKLMDSLKNAQNGRAGVSPRGSYGLRSDSGIIEFGD